MKDFFLTSDRLGFSVWEKGDLSDALKLWGSPEVTRYITADGRMSREQIRKRLEREIEMYKKFNVQYWPVYIKEIGKNAGCCGLRPYDYKNKTYEMGIHLKEQYWGCGLAQEACSAVMKYAFTVLGAGAIFAGHNPDNTASARLLKRLRFTYLRDELYLPTGLYHPSYLMTAEEYKNR